jgi:hypothetical protein
MSTWATACYASAYGVSATEDLGGCSAGYTLAGEFQRLIDTYSYTLIYARDRASQGLAPGFGGGTSYPWQVAETLKNTASYYCQTYPGACPADPGPMTQQYLQILQDTVAQYGFDMNGNYSHALDNQPGVDVLYPTGIVSTPAVDPTGNVASYSPSAGWRPPIDSIAPTVSPTIPAFTAPANLAATEAETPNALTASGGSTVAATASGSGSSVGGSTTQQSMIIPGPGALASIESLSVESSQKKLLIILAVIAVIVIWFGRG